jgi:hypothetical protein
MSFIYKIINSLHAKCLLIGTWGLFFWPFLVKVFKANDLAPEGVRQVADSRRLTAKVLQPKGLDGLAELAELAGIAELVLASLAESVTVLSLRWLASDM